MQCSIRCLRHHNAQGRQQSPQIRYRDPSNAHLQANFRREIDLLKSCSHHANVVGFRAACLDAPGHLLMVMEVGDSIFQGFYILYVFISHACMHTLRLSM